MRRYILFVMCAIGALLTTWQNPVAQSARDADFDANGIVGFGITQRAEPPSRYTLDFTINDVNSGQTAKKDAGFVIAE